MKSIVDKLSSRLEKVENGGGQSGNQGGLSKDEVTQLIKDTDPKKHEHEIGDIQGLDTTKFATKEELQNRPTTVNSEDIKDSVKEYVKSDELYIYAEAPFEVIRNLNGLGLSGSGPEYNINGVSLDSHFTYEFSMHLQVKTDDGAKEIEINDYTFTDKSSPPRGLTLKTINGGYKIICLASDYQRVEVIATSITGGTEEFESSRFIISRTPTNMNGEQLMTAKAVKEYVQEKIGTCHYLYQGLDPNTYNIILCKFEQGQMYKGLLQLAYDDFEICFGIYSDGTGPVGYIKPLESSSQKPYIQAITYNNQNYVSLCINYSGSSSSMDLFTFCCPDKNIIRVLLNDEATPYKYSPMDTTILLEITE